MRPKFNNQLYRIFSASRKVKERSLLPIDISAEQVDGFSKFKRSLDAEKVLQISYRTDH